MRRRKRQEKQRRMFSSSESEDEAVDQSARSAQYTEESSSDGGLSRTDSGSFRQLPPPIQFNFRANVPNMSFSVQDEAPIKDDDDLNLPGAQFVSFRDTVLLAFRKLEIQFNTSAIELTPGELFSMCIGMKYVSSQRKVREICAVPAYFQRVARVLEKYCVRADNERYTLPPVQHAQELSVTTKHQR